MSDDGRRLLRLISSGSLLELKMLKADPVRSAPLEAERITYKDVLIIDAISETENCTASMLADITSLTKPTISVRLKGLEKKGMIRRVRSESDRRVVYLELDPSVADGYRWEEEILQGIVNDLRQRYGDRRVDEFMEMVSDAASTIASCDPKQGETERSRRPISKGRSWRSSPWTCRTSSLPGRSALRPRGSFLRSTQRCPCSGMPAGRSS